MANTSKKAETVTLEDAVVEKSTVASSNVVVEKKTVDTKTLKDDDEIIVSSLIPHVSYKDSKNNDFYEWDTVGHEEVMTYSALKDMNRNYKSYFKDLWLEPKDDRVVKAFGLVSVYKNYADLMDGSIYTIENMSDIKEKFDALPPRGIKNTIVIKIKNMVMSGDISDVKVVKSLERLLNIDLFDLLDL